MTVIAVPNAITGIDAVSLADDRQLLVCNPTTRQPCTWEPRSPLRAAVSSDGSTWAKVHDFDNARAAEGYSRPAVNQTRDGLTHITCTWRGERIRQVGIDL